ncbi:MAG: hypothetical protein P8Y13_01005 [Deinococcales bacterium]
MRPIRIVALGALLVTVLTSCAPGVTLLPEAFKPDPQPVTVAEAGQALAIARKFVGTNHTVMRFLDASSFEGQVGIQEWPVHGVKRGQWIVGAGRLKVIRGPKN